MLLGIHVPKQAQIQKFQETREKRLSALEKKRNRIEGVGYKHSVEIQVDPSFIPRIIGKGGESVRALQDKYGVAIWIMPEDDTDERTIRIFGNSHENIEKTRVEVEFIEDTIPVETDVYRWLLGRNGKTIQGFRDSTGLIYANLDRESRQLRLCGTRSSVQDAIAMFETHLMYYPVFAQMDEEMNNIVQQLEEFGDTTSGWEWGWYRDDDDDFPSMVEKGRAGKGDWGNKGAKGTTGGGKAGKGSSSGTKSSTKPNGGKTGGWAEWEEPHGGGRSGGAKEEASMRDGISEWWEQDESEWWDWNESETWAGLDWHESTEVRPHKSNRGGGGDSKGKKTAEEQHTMNEQHHTATPAKAGGAKTGGKQWQRKDGRDDAAGERKSPEAEKSAEKEQQQGNAAGCDRGRGNPNKGSGGRGGRAATAAAATMAFDEQETASNQQVPSDTRPQRQAPPLGGRRMGKKGVRS